MTLLRKYQNKWEIFSNFVVFLQCLDFIGESGLYYDTARSWQTILGNSNANSKRSWSPLCVHKICMWLESSRQNLILLTFSSLPYILYPGGIPIYTSCTLIQKSVERIILLVQVLRLYHVWMTQFLYLYSLKKIREK